MLTFQELGGSPVEKYTLEDFSATREFLVPWEHRGDFAVAVFGTSSASGKKTRVTYPGRKDVYAASLRFEPFDPGSVNIRVLENLKTDAVDYDGSYAKAVVEYRTVDSRERSDGPLNEEGTSITYRMAVESAAVELPPAAWAWGNGQAVSAETSLVKSIPETIHYVTWSNVVDPPWNEIMSRQGTINNATFLGCEAGTLLFEGAEANKLYRRGAELDEGPSSFVWAIKYAFREKAVKSGGGTRGWNHVYRPETGLWEIVRNGTNYLYDSSDFNTLFRTVLPDDVP